MRVLAIARGREAQPVRSGIAVAAQRRVSAGPMRDRRARRQRDRERRLVEDARRGEA
jgi:hypothetical protein